MRVIVCNWCTKLCVKNRWWTSGSYLGICPNFRWRQVKQWWLFRLLIEESYTWLCLCYLCSYSYSWLGIVVWNYSCFIDYTCGGCGLIMLPMWFIMWNGGSICLAHFIWEELMLWTCIMHSSSIALKFRRDLMVQPYRYNEHHMLPEKGYDAASYP
jgi:hypothetical protein